MEVPVFEADSGNGGRTVPAGAWALVAVQTSLWEPTCLAGAPRTAPRYPTVGGPWAVGTSKLAVGEVVWSAEVGSGT